LLRPLSVVCMLVTSPCSVLMLLVMLEMLDERVLTSPAIVFAVEERLVTSELRLPTVLFTDPSMELMDEMPVLIEVIWPLKAVTAEVMLASWLLFAVETSLLTVTAV
jgi:hypothetical protein